MEEITNLIQTVGFPIFVSVYFMFRLEQKQSKMIELQNKILILLGKPND